MQPTHITYSLFDKQLSILSFENKPGQVIGRRKGKTTKP